jgi:myo-inositol 2-dehydrogenase / D-chiro-inositol 1-dehydrogenase
MELDNGRRRFLMGALAAASARPAGAQEREIRTAMIGVGVRGTDLVRQVLEQRNTPIAAICDTDANARDRAQGLARRHSPKSYSDYRAILDLKDVEAVVIATPCYLHAEMSVVDAGKYVYCEKPLGITPEQALVLKAAKRAKSFLQIGQQLR